MKYIVTAESILWGYQREALKTYSNDVIFIHYTKRRAEDKQSEYGRHLICEIRPMLGMDENVGIRSREYSSLHNHKDELLEMIADDSVTVLSDMDVESLYPYKLLLDAVEFEGELHLIGVSPFLFMSARRRENYENMLRDTGRTNSVAVLDADIYLKSIENRHITLPEVLKNIGKLLLKPISEVSELVIEEEEATLIYKYDFALKKYSIINRMDYSYYSYGRGNLAGIGPATQRRNEKATAPIPLPTPNGKELCCELRSARVKLAKANRIPFESPECSSEDECGGTCEVCDEELKYLNQEMEKIPKDQRKYPDIL